MLVDNWWATLNNILYPTKCLGCGVEGAWLCAACNKKLIYNRQGFCLVCGRPSFGGFTHSNCQLGDYPGRLLSCFSYRGPSVVLIKAFKYRHYWPLAKELAGLIVRWLKKEQISFTKDFWVTSIPFDWRRQLTKPANHARFLAQSLSGLLGLEYHDLLYRRGWSVSQTALSRARRKGNVKEKFTANPRWVCELPNHPVLLVDDVVTTGATLLEASGALKRNGSKQVVCLTLARD
ncbi:hypothetical protein COT52_01725 [candidate division WWE3 bacterium CG08_land_8_20_14_0_20_43_13]|uniref:Phosphoribosyltransferase domain-containing protein n=1 Tax=candidate division WWE3 bacterium CG08_land_8_20_14_0_20_43_13 TaxID=1975087 RepID=A0A2H0X9I2_UNCKA|nr:MAG: hypothetical protein COT52_01725 [candidate division WWE3 bacterium CG08_land_8_20_14_0_20_43_13]